MSGTAPFLDLADPTFDVNSDVVHDARGRDWFAETPYGWAVLRYDQGTALLKDRRFQQGTARWPEQNGIHDGPWQQWWGETLLSLEGTDHLRLRKLLGPAFRSRTIEAMRPQFQALANTLIDGFAARGRVEFVSEFAEPYAACQTPSGRRSLTGPTISGSRSASTYGTICHASRPRSRGSPVTSTRSSRTVPSIPARTW